MARTRAAERVDLGSSLPATTTNTTPSRSRGRYHRDSSLCTAPVGRRTRAVAAGSIREVADAVATRPARALRGRPTQVEASPSTAPARASRNRRAQAEPGEEQVIAAPVAVSSELAAPIQPPVEIPLVLSEADRDDSVYSDAETNDTDAEMSGSELTLVPRQELLVASVESRREVAIATPREVHQESSPSRLCRVGATICRVGHRIFARRRAIAELALRRAAQTARPMATAAIVNLAIAAGAMQFGLDPHIPAALYNGAAALSNILRVGGMLRHTVDEERLPTLGETAEMGAGMLTGVQTGYLARGTVVPLYACNHGTKTCRVIPVTERLVEAAFGKTIGGIGAPLAIITTAAIAGAMEGYNLDGLAIEGQPTQEKMSIVRRNSMGIV